MTLGTQTILAERFSRSAGANTVTSDSDITKQYINEGVREFAKRAHGIAAEKFISLSPKFDIGTDFAIKFTLGGNTVSFGSTDIPLVSSAIYDATPTTLLGHITSNINAYGAGTFTVSMAWSASTWTFQLYGPASCTSIAIASPTGVGYTDGTFAAFGGDVTASGASLTAGMPQDINLETSLPSGFLEMNHVWYGSWPLKEAPFDIFQRPRVFGTPGYYHVSNKKISLYPTPSQQDFFRMLYTAMPTDLGVDGSSDSVSCPLPEEVQLAPVYYAASCLLDESHEFQKSVYYQQKFTSLVNDYKMREANNSPSLFPGNTEYIPPKVII